MTLIWEAFSAKYGAVAIGLAAGVLAKYGLVVLEGKRITWRMLAGDALVMGLVALAAVTTVEKLGLEGNSAAMSSALLALASDRVIRLIKERFIRKIEAATIRDVAQDVLTSKGELREAAQIKLSADRIMQGGNDDYHI